MRIRYLLNGTGRMRNGSAVQPLDIMRTPKLSSPNQQPEDFDLILINDYYYQVKTKYGVLCSWCEFKMSDLYGVLRMGRVPLIECVDIRLINTKITQQIRLNLVLGG
jgi:hypothetical protein